MGISIESKVSVNVKTLGEVHVSVFSTARKTV